MKGERMVGGGVGGGGCFPQEKLPSYKYVKCINRY